MSHVFHQLYYHFAWATHSRRGANWSRLATTPAGDHERRSEDPRRLARSPQRDAWSVLTLRKDEIEKVSRYIDRQEEHHRRGNLSQVLERFDCEDDDWPEDGI